jgi:hypothetical protein
VRVVGHEALRAELERELPPVTLLLGPQSVGKTALAEHAARYHHMSFVGYNGPSAAQAREIVEMVPRHLFGGFSVIIGLDGTTEAAQNILLKVLEEPPPHIRFLLTASRPPLPTVTSRAVVHRVSLLSDAQVCEVLEQLCGHNEAVRCAPLGRGRVAPALEAARSSGETARLRSGVAAALRAAQGGDLEALELTLRNWTPDHAGVLRAWAEEAATGRWLFFSDGFADGVTREQARRVIRLMVRYQGARNAAAVALTGAFREESNDRG